MHRIFRLVLYCLLIAVLCEVGLRFLDPPSLSYYRNIKILHRYHPDYYVTLGANLDIYIRHYSGLWEGRFTTNSLGYRGSPEPLDGIPKIACLGDSLVMGFGVSDEDTFCYQLNGTEINGRRYQSMNLAVDAYGSLGSAKRLQEAFTKLDLEIVLFFVSPNDFTVPPGLAEQGVLPDDIVEKSREHDKDYRRKFYIQFELTRYSYFLHAVKLAQEQLLMKALFTGKEILAEMLRFKHPLAYLGSSFYRFPKEECQKSHIQAKNENTRSSECPESILPDSGCVEKAPLPTVLAPLPEETIYAYNLLLDTVNKNQAHLIVVFIPMQNEDIRCRNSRMHSPLYEYALRSKLFFESRGIPTYELMDYADEICPIEEFFIPGDGHLTKKGNHWVSDKLKSYLKKFYLEKGKI